MELWIRVAVAIVLVAAGSLKFLHQRAFGNALRALGLIPARSARAAAILISLSEVLLAIALLSVSSPMPLLLSMLLFGTFAGALTVALLRGTSASCGCFGGSGRLKWTHPARALCLAAVSMVGLMNSLLPLAVAGGLLLAAIVLSQQRGRATENPTATTPVS